MMNSGELVSVNGRRRKLLFCPDAVEAWIRSKQTSPAPVIATAKVERKKSNVDNDVTIRLLTHAAGRKPKAK